MSATEKTQKRRLGKVLRIYRRAFGLVCRESGGYTAILVVEKVLDTCMPYWDIWFTARLLDEIWGGRSPKLLVLYAFFLLAGNLALTFLGQFLNAMEGQKRFEFSQKENMIFTKKIMELDYNRLSES